MIWLLVAMVVVIFVVGERETAALHAKLNAVLQVLETQHQALSAQMASGHAAIQRQWAVAARPRAPIVSVAEAIQIPAPVMPTVAPAAPMPVAPAPVLAAEPATPLVTVHLMNGRGKVEHVVQIDPRRRSPTMTHGDHVYHPSAFDNGIWVYRRA